MCNPRTSTSFGCSSAIWRACRRRRCSSASTCAPGERSSRGRCWRSRGSPGGRAAAGAGRVWRWRRFSRLAGRAGARSWRWWKGTNCGSETWRFTDVRYLRLLYRSRQRSRPRRCSRSRQRSRGQSRSRARHRPWARSRSRAGASVEAGVFGRGGAGQERWRSRRRTGCSWSRWGLRRSTSSARRGREDVVAGVVDRGAESTCRSWSIEGDQETAATRNGFGRRGFRPSDQYRTGAPGCGDGEGRDCELELTPKDVVAHRERRQSGPPGALQSWRAGQGPGHVGDRRGRQAAQVSAHVSRGRGVVLNKIDLLPYVECDLGRVVETAANQPAIAGLRGLGSEWHGVAKRRGVR